MKILKLQGCGNDFIFTEDTAFENILDKRAFVKKICQRKFSVGADGFIFLKKQTDDFHWDFYNSDGSDAEMCGNAARCAALYIQSKYKINKTNLVSLAGRHELMADKGEYTVEMLSLSSLETLAESIYFINTGVPHVVVINPIETQDVIKKFRYHDNGVDDKGCNVSILSKEGNRNLVKTFERGVEGFTMACGTGAVAAAFVLRDLNGGDKISLVMPGGKLSVSFLNDKVYLSGASEIVFEGEIDV